MNHLDKLYSISSGSRRNEAMEGLRAYAALVVFFVHFTWGFGFHTLGINYNDLIAMELLAECSPHFLMVWLFSGHYGVDLFFLLSGYLISGMVIRKYFSYPIFMFHRVLRIYPVLIVSTLAYVLCQEMIGMQRASLNEIAGNLILLNGIPLLNFPYINQPSWSIFFEFAFYAVFPLLWKLSGNRLVVTWIMVITIVLPLAILDDRFIRFMMFMAGATLRLMPKELLARIMNSFSEGITISLYLLSTLWFVFDKSFHVFIPLYIFTAGLLVAHALEGGGILFKLFSLKLLRYFGNISFSFYLFQIISLMLTRQIMSYIHIDGIHFYFIVYLSLSLVITTTIATLSFVVLEKPYFRNKDRLDKYLGFSSDR